MWKNRKMCLHGTQLNMQIKRGDFLCMRMYFSRFRRRENAIGFSHVEDIAVSSLYHRWRLQLSPNTHFIASAASCVKNTHDFTSLASATIEHVRLLFYTTVYSVYYMMKKSNTESRAGHVCTAASAKIATYWQHYTYEQQK